MFSPRLERSRRLGTVLTCVALSWQLNAHARAHSHEEFQSLFIFRIHYARSAPAQCHGPSVCKLKPTCTDIIRELLSRAVLPGALGVYHGTCFTVVVYSVNAILILCARALSSHENGLLFLCARLRIGVIVLQYSIV